MAATPHGKIIVFEGCDGAGKSTHVELLNEWLDRSGRTAVVLHYPSSSTPCGTFITSQLTRPVAERETPDMAMYMHKLFFSGAISP